MGFFLMLPFAPWKSCNRTRIYQEVLFSVWIHNHRRCRFAQRRSRFDAAGPVTTCSATSSMFSTPIGSPGAGRAALLAMRLEHGASTGSGGDAQPDWYPRAVLGAQGEVLGRKSLLVLKPQSPRIETGAFDRICLEGYRGWASGFCESRFARWGCS
jgi:hypothetical protein